MHRKKWQYRKQSYKVAMPKAGNQLCECTGRGFVLVYGRGTDLVFQMDSRQSYSQLFCPLVLIQSNDKSSCLINLVQVRMPQRRIVF